MSVPHYPLHINGEWVDTDEKYEIRSPATGELVATVAKGGVTEVDAAVAAAKAAHAEGTWRNTPPAERAALINNVALSLGGRLEELAALQTRENGVTIRVTGALHIGLSVAQMQYIAAQAAIVRGKFHGVISATTPSGSRTVNAWPPPTGIVSPSIRSGAPA